MAIPLILAGIATVAGAASSAKQQNDTIIATNRQRRSMAEVANLNRNTAMDNNLDAYQDLVMGSNGLQKDETQNPAAVHGGVVWPSIRVPFEFNKFVEQVNMLGRLT